MVRWTPVLSAVLLALGVVCAAADGMSRQEKEAFLRKARVVSVKDVGEGATHPLKVKLDDGKTRMKAIFKSIDLHIKKTPMRFKGETVQGYVDSYKSEIAAYELDKLLGLNALPVIVERRIKGKRGSLREWVEDVMPRYGHGTLPADMSRAADQVQMVWLFDYLIYNVDRRTHNLMLGSGWRPVLIDHSMAFTTFEKPFRPLSRFPRGVFARLRELDRSTVRKALRRYLRRNQIEALMRRREILLDTVDRQVSERGEAEVFYSLESILR